MVVLDPAKTPRHVAIIPDGNGRWAESRGLARNEGHARGVEVVREVVEAAHELGVRYLTLYAFSMENWGRPTEEVDALMRLMERYLQRETGELVERGVRVRAIGRLELLKPNLRAALHLCGPLQRDLPAPDRRPRPRHGEPLARAHRGRRPVDGHVALQRVPTGRELGQRELERHERVEVRRDVQGHGLDVDRPSRGADDLAHPRHVDPDLVRIAVGGAQHERAFHRRREPFEMRAERDQVLGVHVPCCHEWR